MAEEKTEKVESKKETKKEARPTYELVSVATQTAQVIQNTVTGQAVTEQEALVAILNEVQQIKRLVG